MPNDALSSRDQAARPANTVTSPPDSTFGYQSVCEMAKQLSLRPFQENDSPCPDVLTTLSYDEYRDIRYKPDHAIWKGLDLGYELQLFHRGFIFPQKVIVNAVENGQTRPIPYRHEDFHFPTRLDDTTFPAELGFAGWRVHYPLNDPNIVDELAAFLGASYFRAIGAGQIYGASCRAVAVDTALPEPEEFPRFQELWIVRPPRQSPSLTLYALLNGRSLTGAYQFDIFPGETTRVEVIATLYARNQVKKLGLAPITSMFYYGENSPRPDEEFRPEVHDSDGLLIANGKGEFLWRPLVNPTQNQLYQFSVPGLRGFGLLQRDREFKRYRDREALYHKRPSVWIEPTSKWPDGVVELFELTTSTEIHDNTNAYWKLDSTTVPKSGLEYRYRIHLIAGDPPDHTSGKAISTRSTPLGAHGQRFTIEFDSPQLRRLHRDSPVRGRVKATQGTIENINIKRKPKGTWRLAFDCYPNDPQTPADLRAFLESGNSTLTETWNAVCP